MTGKYVLESATRSWKVASASAAMKCSTVTTYEMSASRSTNPTLLYAPTSSIPAWYLDAPVVVLSRNLKHPRFTWQAPYV